MKIVMTKCPADSKFKAGQELEETGAALDVLANAGHEYVSATEYQMQQDKITARESRIDKAIDSAIKAGSIKPKDDAAKATIRAKALKMEEAEDGLGSEFINARGVDNANDKLFGRQTKSSEPSGIVMGKETAQEAAQGVVKAMTTNTKAIKASMWSDAFEHGRTIGTRLKKLLELGGEDMQLSDIVAGASHSSREIGAGFNQGIIQAADYSDPNSQVGTLATGLILMRNLGFLKNKLGFLKYISTDLRNEAALFGQPIFTRYFSVSDVLTYVPGVGFTKDATTIAAAGAGTVQTGIATPTALQIATTPTNYVQAKSAVHATDVTVTMNRFKACEIEFPITSLSATVRNLFAEQRAVQTYTLALSVNQNFLDTLFGATWSGIVSKMSLGAFGLPTMVSIKNRMTLSQIPDIGRYALLHSYYHDALLTDTNLLTAKAIMALINKDASSFEQAEVPSLFGVKPLETQLASYASGTATSPAIDATTGAVSFAGINQVGFAGNMSSMLFVSRVPQDFTQIATQLGIPPTSAVEIITEPDSGLTVMIFKYVDNGKMSISVRMCLMWGIAQGHPGMGIVLTP